MPPTGSPLPPPRDVDVPLAALVRELSGHLGEPTVVDLCVDLLGGAPREAYLAELPYLTGLSFEPGSSRLDPERWKPFWPRHWGARGLLHVWAESAAPAVVAGLADAHWRPAETCLRVAVLREVGGAGDRAAMLSTHELPRVRAQAVRALGALGDTEHVAAVRVRLDDAHPDVRRQAARALERLAERLDLVMDR